MKSRILVVDDNVDLTTLLAKTLERFGYEVVVENDSSFAVDTTRRLRPNLILLDVMMPHRDGGEVLHDLRHDLLLRGIPVILLTGLAREAQGLADQGGIRSVVLSKPIELKLLLQEIETHIEATKTFRQMMTERAEQKGIETPRVRRGNAFGGPDPATLQQGRGMTLPETPAEKKVSPFRRLLGGRKNTSDVEMPR
ncbi:MAG: response regulator [Verrucomicrobiales bacterium]|nr:response regulator [Verrucomicrobiales bacterium]